MNSSIRRDQLMEVASTQSGLDDFGDTDFHEPLDALVESLNREARLEGEQLDAVQGTLVSLLVKRLSVTADRKTFPAVADEEIIAPVFIVGLPRTGSTLLHGLMGSLPGVRVPRFWEMTMPSPPPDSATATTDPRIARVQSIVDAMPEDLLRRHPMGAMRAEQCNMLNDWSFLHQALLASYEIPSYRDYLFNADYAPAFDVHRRMLQHLQWKTGGRWVLKYPKHLIALEALLDAYPDAQLVWTHRDPVEVIPSVCSLTGYMRSSTAGYDPARFGAEWSTLEELVLRRGLTVRDRLTDADTRIHDLRYSDLMSDPVKAVAGICAQFDIAFDDASRTSIEEFLAENPKTKHGEHRYTPEDFGLTADGIERRFAFYTERFA
jgi:Sulfotransferase family